MRVPAIVALLAGCGRIDFEPRPDASGVLTCPAGYTDAAPGCYRVVVDPPVEPIWVDAEAACEADGPGAHLVVVDDLDEALRLRAVVPDDLVDHYIGVSDLVTEGVYVTVTDVPMTFLPWAPSEPTGNSEDCMMLDNTHHVLDTSCSDVNDYVCEYDGFAAVPSAWGQ